MTQTHRQKTPVTHRQERVGLTDAQQMQLGERGVREDAPAVLARESSSPGPATSKCSGSPGGSRPWPAVTNRPLSEGDSASQERGKCLLSAGRQDRRTRASCRSLETTQGSQPVLATKSPTRRPSTSPSESRRQHLTGGGCSHHRGRRGGHARSIHPDQGAARRRRRAASLPFSRATGIRGRPHRARLHGESADTTHARRSPSEAHAAGVEGEGAARVRERPPKRRNTGWSGSRNGCPRRSWRTSRLRGADATRRTFLRNQGSARARTEGRAVPFWFG